MNYIIFDLEWNNAYDYKAKKGINEIIEIGAVKLDRNLNITDTFKQLIKPKLSRKLSKRFVDLTSITQEEINNNGIPFKDAISDFARWAGDGALFMSWSNSDLYVLVSNYIRFFGTSYVPFIKYYTDVQKYCQQCADIQGRDQVSLAHCAEFLSISVDKDNLHRALEDCYIAAECFKSVFDKDKLKGFISECDEDFFGRLAFKPFIITKPVSEHYNFFNEKFSCPVCNEDMKQVGDVQLINNSFRTVCTCKKCKKKFWAYARVKKVYDGVSVAKRITRMSKNKYNKS